MAISTNEIAQRLFKKLLGKGDTSTNRAFYEEAYNGPLQVFSNNIWTDTSKIPTVFLPTFRTLSGSTVQNLINDSYVYPDGTTGLTQNNAVVQIKTYTLTKDNGSNSAPVGDSQGFAFVNSSATDIIPFTYGNPYSYYITYNSGSVLSFGSGDSVFDPESGILKFYTANIPSDWDGSSNFVIKAAKYIGNKLSAYDLPSINNKLNITDFSSYSSNTNSCLGTLTSGLATKVIEDGGKGSTIRINNNNRVRDWMGSSVLGGCSNTTEGDYSFIGGGLCNTTSGSTSSIVGGRLNTVSGYYSFIGGGSGNTVTEGNYSNILGGNNNTIQKNYSFIGGGNNNTIQRNYSGILGGQNNYTNIDNTFIIGSNIIATTENTTFVESLNICSALYDNGSSSGGVGNILSSTETGVRWRSADNIISGSTSVTSKLSLTNFYTYTSNTNNLIGTKLNITDFNSFLTNLYSYTSNTNTLIGTKLNTNSFNSYSANTNTLIGTKLNIIDFNIYSAQTDSRLLFSSGTIGSTFRIGSGNISSGNYSSVLGGLNNTVSCQNSFIGGGCGNTIVVPLSSIVGGENNRLCGAGCNQFIGGGNCNSTSASNSVVVGGYCNFASGGQTFVGGGFKNVSCQAGSFVGAGYCNTSCGCYSFVGGGANNTIICSNSFIGGGANNIVNTFCSGILGGQNNYTNISNTFILGSNITATTSNTTFVERLNIKCGVYDNNNSIGVSGQLLTSNGNGVYWNDPIYSGTTSCGTVRLFSSNVIDGCYSSVLGGSFNMNYSCGNSSINNGTMNIVGGSVISYPVSQISGGTSTAGSIDNLSLTSCDCTQSITDNTYTVRPYTISGNGGGAVLDITFNGSCDPYAPSGYTITNRGVGYKVGDIIRIPSYIPGFGYQTNLITYTADSLYSANTNFNQVTILGNINSGNSNFIPGVSGILTSLGIYAYNSSGDIPSNGTYDVTGFTSGIGSGSRLSLTYDSGTNYPTSISVLSGGTNYSVGDIIVIDGSSVGLPSSSGFNDLYLTATSVSSITGDNVILYNPSNNNTYTSTVIGSSYSCPNTIISTNSTLGDTTSNGFIINSCRLTASGSDNVVLGGINNVINGTSCSFIGNGQYNKISSAYSTIGNGKCNTISTSSAYSTILGGCSNILSNCHSFILGTNIKTSADCTTYVNCLNINNIPTSSAGLPPGSVWSNGGILTIV